MDKSEIESYVKAGEIAKEVKVFARELARPGVKLLDIAEGIDAKILELGGECAFPVNLGLNEVAAHFTPAAGDETVAEGVLKMDIGVVVDGYIADTAISFDLTPNGEFKEMIKLNKKILSAATDRIFRGVGVSGCRGVGGQQSCPTDSVKNDYERVRVCDIGEACSCVMDEAGDEYAIVRSLCGHALGRNIIHTSPTVSNCRNDSMKVLDNIAFAVEPFVTTGVGDIFEGKGGGIYTLKGNGNVRDRDARKVLEFVRENYETRPFCLRWISKAVENEELDVRENKLKLVIGMLVRAGIFYEYPILIEKSRKPVSQFENTFLIVDGKVIQTT